MDSLGKNTGAGCHFLLQGIFPTQESDLGLLHCRQVFYHLSYKGSTLIIKQCEPKLWDTISHQSKWPSLKYLQVANIGAGMEKKTILWTDGENVNWCKFLKKLKIELPYDPVIPLLGIYLDKTIMHTPVFTEALFTIAKTWRQHKMPIDRWMAKDVVYIYNGIYSTMKKNGIMPYAEYKLLILW